MNPVSTAMDNATPSKETLGLGFKILVFLLSLGLISGFIYWFFFLKRISWAEVKRLISLESAKYKGKEAPTEHILLQGAQEILSHPHLAKQAMEFASSSNIPIERVVVDNAIAMAKNLNYLPVIPKDIVSPAPPLNPNTTV